MSKGIFGLIVFLSAVQAGCGDGNNSSTVASGTRQYGSLRFTLSAPKAAYAKSEAVPLTFTVKNVGSQLVSATVASCDYFDIKASQGDQVKWQYLATVGCGASVVQVTIQPGETKTYSKNWDQTDTQGNPVSSGQYSIKVWFTGANLNDPNLVPGKQETTLFANPITVTIQ